MLLLLLVSRRSIVKKQEDMVVFILREVVDSLSCSFQNRSEATGCQGVKPLTLSCIRMIWKWSTPQHALNPAHTPAIVDLTLQEVVESQISETAKGVRRLCFAGLALRRIRDRRKLIGQKRNVSICRHQGIAPLSAVDASE